MMHLSPSRPLLFRLLVLVAPAVVLACPCAAHAGYVQQTFTMNQSNTFADGIAYGTVKVEAYNGVGPAGGGLVAGQVRLTVKALTPAVYGALGSNFGMDKFGFETTLHLTAGQISGPSGWSPSFGKDMDGFGRFSVELAGGGKNRLTTAVFTISGLGANAILANFEIGSQKKNGGTPDEGSVYFAAHVADFANCEGSNFIGGNKTDGDPPPHHSPEPATLSLTLVGVAGLGLARYLRRRVPLGPRAA